VPLQVNFRRQLAAIFDDGPRVGAFDRQSPGPRRPTEPRGGGARPPPVRWAHGRRAPPLVLRLRPALEARPVSPGALAVATPVAPRPACLGAAHCRPGRLRAASLRAVRHTAADRPRRLRPRRRAAHTPLLRRMQRARAAGLVRSRRGGIM